jgi:ABC-type proline/glycine betaine transport system substrate-binding protein
VTTWNRKAGDYGPPLVVQLNGSVDLAAVTAIEGHVSLRGGTAVVLPATVTDIAEREATIDVSAWLPTAVVGAWDLEVQADVLNEDDPVTWPETGHDRINVGRQLA